MRKIIFFILFLFPAITFASASVTYSNPTFSGNTFTKYGDPYLGYVFDNSGVNSFGNAVGTAREFSTGAQSFTKTLTDLNYINLTQGTYTAYFINTGIYGATADTDCGGTKTRAQCESGTDTDWGPTDKPQSIASTTFYIVGSTSTITSSTILCMSTSTDLIVGNVFNSLYLLIWAGAFFTVFYVVFKMTKR